MSTSAALLALQRDLFRYGGPTLLGIGTLSSMLNLLVFSKGALRKSPCTICLIAVSISDFLFLYFGLLLTTLATGYDIDPSSYDLAFCRFRFYIATVIPCYESTGLILASIDRALVTSSNANTRKFSTHRMVLVSIISLCFFWTVFHVHAWVLTDILQFGPDYFVCFHRPGLYTVLITYYSLLINGALPPILMAVFGCWTVKNIRRVRRVTQRSTAVPTEPTGGVRPHRLHSKDQQLIRMLLVDIIIFVVCKSPLTLFYMYQQITQHAEKSVEQQVVERAILHFTYFLFFAENCLSCYTNFLVSKTFRAEVIQIFRRDR